MRSRCLALEVLEHRSMLTAGVAAQPVAVLPQESLPGDAEQNGAFGQSDLVEVLQTDKYLTGQWAESGEGDCNKDGGLDRFDLTHALQAGKFKGGAHDALDPHGLAAEAHGRSVTRPMKAVEEVTVTVDLTTATPAGTADFRFDQVGHATHLGAFRNIEGTGVWDLVNNIPLSMETTLIAANGDTLHGASNVPGFLYFDGGTGRFADAVGWSKYTPISVSAPIVNPGTITISFVNHCEGELTF